MELLWKPVWQLFKRLHVELLYEPAILLLATHPSELKRCVHTNTYTWMFVAALFTISKSTNNTNVHQLTNGYIHVVYPCNGISCDNKKKLFYCPLLYCASQISYFLQITSFWQTCIKSTAQFFQQHLRILCLCVTLW